MMYKIFDDIVGAKPRDYLLIIFAGIVIILLYSNIAYYYENQNLKQTMKENDDAFDGIKLAYSSCVEDRSISIIEEQYCRNNEDVITNKSWTIAYSNLDLELFYPRTLGKCEIVEIFDPYILEQLSYEFYSSEGVLPFFIHCDDLGDV